MSRFRTPVALIATLLATKMQANKIADSQQLFCIVTEHDRMATGGRSERIAWSAKHRQGKCVNLPCCPWTIRNVSDLAKYAMPCSRRAAARLHALTSDGSAPPQFKHQ